MLWVKRLACRVGETERERKKEGKKERKKSWRAIERKEREKVRVIERK